MPTRAAIASAAAAGNTNNDERASGTDERITVGRLVDVASRTWPGINKPGGIARVTRLYEDEGEPLVDVSYVVGSSKEKRVPLEYVTLAPDYEVGTTTDSSNSRQFVIRPSGLRDRSLLLGRCRRCGSLRADCGSCDWVTEEEELKQKQLQQQQEEQMMPAKSTVLEDSSSSSDDSEVDMVALRELFRRNQEKYRSRMKNRRQSNSRRMETTKKSDEAAQAKRPQAASKRKDADSSDHNVDTDDDDDLDDLLLQNHWRFRRQPQRQKKWQHRLKVFSNTPSAKLKTRKLNHRSVLESLGEATSSLPRTNENLVDAESRKRRRKGASGHINHGTMNLQQSRSLHSPQSPILQRQIEQQRETNVEKNDVDTSAEMPSPESRHQDSSFVPFDGNDNDDDDLPSTQAQVSELQQRVPSYLHDSNDAILMDAADNIFIQPEGHDAAENLPSDMIDRTKDISFANLPKFFDETTDQLENVMIPDYAYRIAKLEREHRRLVSSGSLSQTTFRVTKLLQDCSSLYNEMEHAIIREGIDQCTIALKKLSDDRLFRKFRKDLSSLQRKKIRSSTHMDARNLRLDALEDSVKDLVRNLRRLLERLEEMNDHIMENEDSDIESLNDHAFQARNVVARDTAAGMEDLVHPNERELGTFHPHHFATRQKKTSNSIKTNRRKSVDKDKNVRQPKRRRGNVDGEVSMDNFIVDDSSHQQGSNKPRQMKPISSEYTADTAQDNGGRTAGVDASTNRPHDESSEDENDDDTAIANLFDDEASSGSVRASGDTRVTSSATVSSRRPQRTIARSSNIQDGIDNNWDMPSRYKRDSIPIARRMQAFLDKNNECSFSDDDEQDNQEIAAFSKARSRRQGVISNNGDRRRQYGSSAVLNGQSLTDGASSLPSGRSERDHSSRSSRRESVVPDTIISREYLLSRMEDHDEISINRDTSNLGTPAQLAANQIHEAYLNDPSRVIEAVERLQSTSLRANTTCVKELQDSAMNLLARHGHQSIIESIVARSKYLAVNLRLLAVLVRRNDEIILGGRREDFLSLVIFQMVDAVYALLHPTAWTPYEVDRERALQLLESFRDDLAQSIPLVEAVCRCIMQQLPCQEWKVSDGHEFMYISSFEPSLWTRFVKHGECTLIPCPETRYQKLGKVWPRIEIEAMWNLLLFFGTVCSKNDQTNQNRWQLVSKLFSSSVLAKSSSHDHSAVRLPPNPDLLRAFEADMECFSSLIRKGAMDDLPPTDKLLFSMLKRALSLQAEDYYGNGESRFRSHPTLGTHRKAQRLASRLWKSTQRLMNLDHPDIAGNSTCVHELVFSPSNEGTAVNYMRDLLLPSSGLLGGCLSLVVRWGGRLPKKKVRQSRFLKGLKALRDSLFTLESEIVEKGTSATSANDAFTNAFEGTLPHGVETPESRVSLFFAEVKCYLLILESILDTSQRQPNEAMVNGMRLCGKGLSQSTVIEVWETISCDALEALRQSVLNTPSKPPCGYLGSFQCFLSGKIMAIVAFLCLGVSPWRIDVNQTAQERLCIDVDEYNSRIEYYAYPLSCLFTCISALSSQAKDSTFLCHLISSVVLLFNQLTTIVVAKGTSPTINRVGAYVDSSYLPLLTGVLKQHCGLDADTSASQMLYGLTLSAIRAVATFQTMRVEKEAEAHAAREMRMSASLVTGSGGDDCFEDKLDDSIFASIETGPFQRDGSSSSSCSKQHWTWIFDTLTSLVDMSVCSTVSEKSSVYLSSTAKFFMRQETQKICDCLIALALAQRACNATPLWSKIVSWIQLANRNDIDTEIERKISKRLLVEICLLCLKRKACRTVVAEHLELFLCGIIRVLLDGNRLELFPTCNFDLLMDLEGDKATREELTAIDTFNGVTSTRPVHMSVKDFKVVLESQRRRRERAGQPWEMIKNISFAFNRDRVFLGDLFRASDHDIPSTFQISITSACLEKEIISCFLFFRNLITQLSRATTHAILYQTMIGSILSILASEILRVVRGLKYIDLTSQGLSKENGGDSDRGRIVALLHAMSEVFIATAAWILRENRSNESSKWKRVQTHLCENILYPLLQRKHFDMTFSLGKLIEVCRPLASLSILAGPSTTTGIPGCSKYFAHCYDIALRRSRQLVSSEILTSVLLSYMIEGVHESERESEKQLCEIVGQSFCTRPSVPRHHSRGPLEEEMDQYLGHVESYAPPSNHKDRMTEKRMDGIRSVIVPKLSQRKNDIVAKRQILRITKHMLIEEDALRCSTMTDVDIMSLTASLARSIRHAFVQCLAMPQVDDELITVIIDCTRNFARLDTAEFEEDRKVMVRLCEELIANIDDWEILCDSELRALYLHSFFRWIFFICNSLSRDGNACMNTVTALRRFCSREKHDLHSDLEIRDFVSKKKNPEVDGDDKNFVTWGRVLASVDFKLFGSKSENERPVMNVYAKSSTVRDALQNVENETVVCQWSPSNNVTRAAKEYMTTIVSNSS